jgi:Arc/MetJ-type ribon-helix-helix transcriptional regulator
MKYANVSVRFPSRLDTEIEQLIEETELYTNKSEFVKEACRARLTELQREPTVAALRLERLLARAESDQTDRETVDSRLSELAAAVDDDDLQSAVTTAREETAERLLDE